MLGVQTTLSVILLSSDKYPGGLRRGRSKGGSFKMGDNRVWGLLTGIIYQRGNTDGSEKRGLIAEASP